MAHPEKFIMPDAVAPSPIRALHSLTQAHRAFLSKALPDLPGEWVLAAHEGYDGYLTLLLLPPDEAAPTLVVSRSSRGFHLHANRSDELREVGTRASIRTLWDAVRGLAGRPPPGGAVPASPGSPVIPLPAA